MPQFTITVNRPEVSVSTTQTGPSVTINETPVSITQNNSTIAVTSTPQTVTLNTAATTIQTTTLDEAFQGDYSSVHTYHRGDLVRYEQSVYVYIDATPRTTAAPDVDTDYWVLLFSETGLTAPQVAGINRAINLTTWSPTTEYSLGDIAFVRDDLELTVNPGVTYPKFTLYRLCHISGSINVNPVTHSSPPSTDGSNNLIFDANSAWQDLSGVRSIDGFSGDISLQALLNNGAVSLNALSFEQGSNENHGSFVVHADDSYFYGNALYIGGSTSDQLVGFLLTNEGGSGYVAMDPADGKIKFTNDLTNVYPLPTSTDDLAQGTTNKYYSDTLVDDHLSGGTGVTVTDGVIAIGQSVATTDSPTFDTVYAGVIRSPLNESVTLRAYNDTGAGTNYDLSVATTGQVNLPTGTTGQARVQSPVDISLLADTKEWVFDTDGTTHFPTYAFTATDGTANQVLTTNGSGTVSFATPSTSNITEGTNLYYTTTRFDDRLATKSTTNLAEGTNLYYTTARQNTDFDARLATKSTTNLAEGTNLYYTSTRANSDFDTRLATKSTTNLSEGTNLYHTDSRVRSALSGSTGITYNNTTGAIAVDTSTIATHSYVGTAIANLVDSSPSTLDTLNELAAALGDDPNFATTTATAIGTKLATADFTTTANTWYSTSDPIQNNTTDDLAEGTTNKYYTETRATNNFGTNLSLSDTNDLAEGSTNKYYTDGRARSAISASGSLSYDANTGVVSYTTPSTTGITEGTNLYYTDDRVTSRINNTSIDALSDVVITTAASGQMMYYNGTNWVNSVAIDSPNLSRFSRTATGTANNVIVELSRNRTDAARATDGGPWLGFGYVGTDNLQSTAGQNAIRSMYDATGNHKLQFMQIPGAYNTPTVIGQMQRGNTFFNNTSGGNMLALTDSAATVRGTTTTIANSANTSTYATFASSGIALNNITTITGAGLSQITRTTVGTPGVAEARPSFNIQLSRSDQAAPANLDGTGFRYRVNGSNGTAYTIADMSANYSTGGDNVWTLYLADGDQTSATFNGLPIIQSKITGTTIAAGTASGTTGGSDVSTVATFQPTATTFTGGGSTYAQFATGSAAITTSGRFTITRTTAGSGLLLTQKTVNAGPVNGDEIDFRLGITGTSTSSNFARVDGTYRSSGLNEIGLSVSTDSFSADSNRIYIGSRESTKILATPTGGGTVSTIMEVSDAKILNNRAHRNAITTGTVARGGTYSLPASANGSISLTITAGSAAVTYVDVDAVASDTATGGMYSILIYNNSGDNNIDVQVRNNGANIGLSNNLDIAHRAMASIYVVGDYAACEIMDAA